MDSQTKREDGSKSSTVVMFDASKSEKYHPGSGMKKLARRLKSSYAVEVNKEDVSIQKLQQANVVVFAGPTERFSSSEFAAIKEFVQDGGSVLFMSGEKASNNKETNLNSFLGEFGMSINTDAVVRTVYYKYLHPKEVFISNGVINREIARVAKTLNSKGKEGGKSSSSKDKGADSWKYNNNSRGNEEGEKDHKGLNFVYPYGATMEVKKPAVPVLSTGFISFPMNRPVAAVWQQGGVSAPPQGSGRIAVLGSVDIFSDAWLEKEENVKLQEILFRWLLRDDNIQLDLVDAEDPDLSEYNRLPDTEALSERLRACLEESEEIPKDFTKLFDDNLFKYDTKLIPEAVKLYEQLDIKAEPLSLIPPQFEAPLPLLQSATFPPILLEPPAPSLDQFDLDEHFAGERIRLAQLTNKCSDDDMEYYIKESGDILGVTPKLPDDKRDAKHILDYIFRQIVNFRKVNQEPLEPVAGNNPTFASQSMVFESDTKTLSMDPAEAKEDKEFKDSDEAFDAKFADFK